MIYPRYLRDRLALGFKCENHFKSIQVSKKMLSLVGIEQMSMWCEDQLHYPPLLKNKNEKLFY